jgi:hypothetical protein
MFDHAAALFCQLHMLCNVVDDDNDAFLGREPLVEEAQDRRQGPSSVTLV